MTRIPVRLSLGPFLLLLCLLPMMGLMGGVAFLAYRNSQNTVEQLAQELMDVTQSQIHAELDEYVRSAPQILHLAEWDLQQEHLRPEDQPDLWSHFRYYLSLFPVVQSLYWVTPQGLMVNLAMDRENDDRPLKTISRASSAPQEQDWYQQALKAPGVIWDTNPQDSATTPSQAIQPAATLGIYRNGQLQGVLRLTLSTQNLNRFLNGLEFAQYGDIVIITRSGDLVVKSCLHCPKETKSSKDLDQMTSNQSLDPLTDLDWEALTLDSFDLSTIQDHQFTIKNQEKLYLGQVNTYTNTIGLDWLVFTIAPQSRFTQTLDSSFAQSIQFLILGGGLYIALGLVVTRLISQPLKHLVNALSQVANQSFEEDDRQQWQLSKSWISEIHDLSQALAAMKTHMTAYIQTLQEGEKRLNNLLNSVPIGVVVLDDRHHVSLINQFGQNILGYPTKRVFMKDLSQAYQVYKAGTDTPYPAEQLPGVRSFRTKIPHRINDVEVQLKYRRIPLEVRSNPIFNEAGDVVSTITSFQDISDRKEAEKLRQDYAAKLASEVQEKTLELKRSEAFLSRILDSANACITNLSFYHDFSICCEFISPKCWDLFGYSVEELMPNAEPWCANIHPDDWQQTMMPAFQTIQTCKELLNQSINYRFQHKNGSIRWILSNCSSCYNLERDCWDVTVVAADITDLKNTQIALKRQENLFRSLFDQPLTGVAFIPIDEDAPCPIQINQTFLDLLHYSLEELIDIPFQNLVDPEDHDRVLPQIDRLQAGEIQHFTQEIRLVPKDQKSFWAEVTFRILHNLPHMQSLKVILVKNINERKTLSLALQTSESKLKKVLDSAIASIIRLRFYPDQSIQYDYISRHCEKIFGYQSEEIFSDYKLWISRIHPEDWQTVFVPCFQFILKNQGESQWELEYRFYQKNDSMIWILANISAAWNPEGNYWNVTVVDTDITDLKLAKDAAEKASQSKGSFIANMSHELRSPLNAILGFARLLSQNAKIPDQEQGYARIIYNSGEHLLNIINQVLDLAKLEANRTQITIQEMVLDELVNNLQSFFYLTAQDMGLTLQVSRADNVPNVICTDITKLRQVLINLMSNSFKFTPSGQVSLTITRIDTPDLDPDAVPRFQAPILNSSGANNPPVYLKFAVQDTGVGIGDDEKSMLFQSFSQTSSGQHQGQGTGLGLAISQGFVQLLGGTIKVDSHVGEGSCFSFVLPVQVASTVSTIAHEKLTVTGLLNPKQSYRFLVVDDSPVNRLVLIKALSVLAIEIQEANSGQEAIDRWEKWHPQVVWMDLKMPHMTGWEAAQHIRDQEKQQGLPPCIIICITASSILSQDSDTQEAIALFDAWILKPFQPQKIFETLTHTLGLQYRYD